ncbi:alpha/beta fold hydrolase [Actinoplanes sp. TFC3]|uniref:alpha/beta fold hydrolase n=1 Tax=Actinoplanes sp. TFC3 TaxID=1710355 RepID=UPI00082FC3A9|nr:alpha/beta hydrolase [Actinoplanes sp. TFC3]
MINDRLVDAGDLPLAIRDFGGDQPPLLLLHAENGNLAQLTTLARALRPAHRVIAMDLRGHGRSGDGAWNWDAGLGDIAAVTVQMELPQPPAVVGVGLGGVLAVLWGQRHPEAPGVVSLESPVQTGLEAGRAFPTAELPDVVTQQRLAAQAAGANEKLWIEAFRRNVVSKDGTTEIRPSAQTAATLRSMLAEVELDLAAGQAPTLAVLRPGSPFGDQVAAAAKTNPQVRFLTLEDASEELLARAVADFLS